MKNFKRIMLGAFFALSMAIIACATPTQSPPTSTFNDKVGLAVQSITVIHQEATSLLLAGKITVAQSKQVRTSLDQVSASLELAKALYTSDPAAAQAMYADALNKLAATKQQVGATP